MSCLPEAYQKQMKELLKEDYSLYEESFQKPSYHGLRVNTSKISVEDFLKISPFHLEPIPWTEDGFYYDSDEKVSKHPYYYAGLYYIQEPSAMLPAQVLEINENDLVLDACAAPGGKSLKLANKLKNTGVLISNDISVSRAQVLLKTLENGGICNAYVMAEDLNHLNNMNESFDKILLDAPCSGEGMFRKDNSLIKSWLEKGNDYYSNLQKDLILKAIDLLKPGGKMVYSTCTFSIKEDEEIIEYALKNRPELKVLKIKDSELFEPGLTENTKNCVRLYPHKIRGEGHFVAYLEKQGPHLPTNLNTSPVSIKLDFFNDISMNFNGKIEIRKEKYYLTASLPFETSSLRILRSGLYLGEMKHDKFEPSQALAYALKEKEYKNILNLEIDDPRVIKYLKCETLDVKDFNLEGYTLVCVNHYPLGFGIIKNGMLKNKYPANYRYQ